MRGDINVSLTEIINAIPEEGLAKIVEKLGEEGMIDPDTCNTKFLLISALSIPKDQDGHISDADKQELL